MYQVKLEYIELYLFTQYSTWLVDGGGSWHVEQRNNDYYRLQSMMACQSSETTRVMSTRNQSRKVGRKGSCKG